MKATLVNAKGKKVVVEAGSQDAQQKFGQGYALMGAGGKPVGPQVASTKATPKASGNQILNTDLMKQYNPNQYSRVGGGVYLNEGVTTKPGTTKEVAAPNPQAEIAGINKQANDSQNTELVTIEQETGKVDLSKSSDLVDKITGILDEKPAPYSAAQTFAEQKSNLGVDQLETDLAGKDTALKALDAEYASAIEGTEGELLSMGAISRRQSQQGIQYNRIRRDMVVERDSIASSLNTKMNTINTIMQLKQTDYQNAKQDFTDKFNMAISLQDMLYKQEDRDLAREDRAVAAKDKVKNEARANLTTMTNLMKESGKTWDQLDPSMKANVTKLELESGLPLGSVSSFMNIKPDAKLLATHTGYDASGNEIASFIYADKDGMPGIVKTVKTGAVKEKTAVNITKTAGFEQESKKLGGDNFVFAKQKGLFRVPKGDGGYDFYYQNVPGQPPKVNTNQPVKISVDKFVEQSGITRQDALKGSLTDKEQKTGTETEAGKIQKARSGIASFLNKNKGEDGYVSPDSYKKSKSAWIDDGFLGEDFDKAFRSFANPSHYKDYSSELY